MDVQKFVLNVVVVISLSMVLIAINLLSIKSTYAEAVTKYLSQQTSNREVTREISQKGLDLIKHFEGLAVSSYQCSAGVWTIGYGHTKTAAPNQVISQFEAEELLKEDVVKAEQCVLEDFPIELGQEQFDALVSFTFNVGCKAYRSSTLFNFLQRGEYKAVSTQFKRWVYAKGKFLKGLERRRLAEKKLYLSTLDQSI